MKKLLQTSFDETFFKSQLTLKWKLCLL